MWTLQQQRITCLQDHFTWLFIHTLSLTSHCYQNHVVTTLETAVAHASANQIASEVDVGCTELTVVVYLIDVIHMMICCHQSVTLLKLQDFIDLSGIDQTIAPKDIFIVRNRRDDFLIETYDFNQRATMNFLQSRFTDRLHHSLIVSRNQQFHGIVARIFERYFWRLTVGHEVTHYRQEGNTSQGTSQTRNQWCKKIERGPCGLYIQTSDDQVGRLSQQRTHTSEGGSVAQWDKQFGRSDFKLSGPHLHHVCEQ